MLHQETALGASSPGPQPAQAERIDPEAVRAYDIRGVAGRQVTAAGVRRLGLAYASLARGQGLRRIGVGRDGRLSSERLERALVQGLVEGGAHVERIGLCPTPQLGFAVHELGLDGAIMVTASHNPAPENGLKLMLGHERIHGGALQALTAMTGAPAGGGGARAVQVQEPYLRALMQAASGLKPLTVAWDSGNGATGVVVEELTRRLPGRHILLNTEIDGRFPNHHPDPAVAGNLAQLQAVVRTQGCDLGLAFDGDGDRIGVVDAHGEPLAADLLMLFLARDLLARCPGATVIGDVKSSRLLFEGVRQAGGRAVVAPSGYVLVQQAMRREGALLAGELSGHVFFADGWNGIDDALYAAVRVLRAVSQGPDLAAFRATLPPSFATPELRLACTDAGATVAALAERTPDAEFDASLGLRRYTADGWWLARASGTEPKITCRCEAGSAGGLERLKEDLFARLQACGVYAGAASSPSREMASR